MFCEKFHLNLQHKALKNNVLNKKQIASLCLRELNREFERENMCEMKCELMCVPFSNVN